MIVIRIKAFPLFIHDIIDKRREEQKEEGHGGQEELLNPGFIMNLCVHVSSSFLFFF